MYNLYLGGAFDGTRLSKLYRGQIGHDAIVAALAPLFRAYATDRRWGERFSQTRHPHRCGGTARVLGT